MRRKVAKLKCRDSGNLMNKVLLAETQWDYMTLTEKRKMVCTRRLLEEKRVEESKEEEDVAGTGASKALGAAKVNDGMVPDCKTKLIMRHFNIPRNNRFTINK